MRYYLLKALYITNPFEFKSFQVNGPKDALKTLGQLERWRPQHYKVLMDTNRVTWTEESTKVRNVFVRIPAENRIPPLTRIHHIFITDVMPYLNSQRTKSEDRGQH